MTNNVTVQKCDTARVFVAAADGYPLAVLLSLCLIMQNVTGLFCHWIKCIIYVVGWIIDCRVCACVAQGQEDSQCQDK